MHALLIQLLFLALWIPAPDARAEAFVVRTFTVDSCPRQMSMNRCSLPPGERQDYYHQVCKDLNRSEHETAEDAKKRQDTCFQILNATGLAACTACRPIMDEHAKHKNKNDPREPSSVARPARPPGPASTPPECAGAESCHRHSAEDQRRALAEAREKRAAYIRSIREARRGRISTITSATNILNNWKKAMDANPQTTPAERTRYESDLRLLQQAKAASESQEKGGDISFSEDDSKKVSDPGVREDLSIFAESRELERDLTKEDKLTEQDARQFESLASQNNNRAQALGTAPGATSPAFAAPATAHVPTIALASGKSAASSAGEGKLERDEAESEATASRRLSGAPTGGLKTGAEKDSTRPYRSTLRDTIRKRLAAGGKDLKGVDKDAFQGDSFEKGLDAPSVPKEKSDKDSLFESVVAEASQWNKAGGGSRDGNIGPFLEAMERDLASATGLMGMDTASLFERVRSAHRSCLARDCVNSLNP